MKALTNCLFAFSIILLTTGTALSQKDKKDGPDLITFTAGWSNADLVINGDEVTDVRHGFFAGIRKDFKLAPIFRLNTGLLYVQKGATFKIGEENTEYALDYLEIPVGLKAKIGPVYATAGLSGNIRLNSEIEGVKTNDSDLYPDVNAFELSSSLGLGVKFLMLSLDARWQYGLSEITTLGDDGIHNNYFLIGLGFSIKGRK